MSFNAPWWSGSYQVNGSGIAVATFKWIPKPIIGGLDGPVRLSRWWGLVWMAPEMPATEFAYLLGLLSSAVAITTPSQSSPTTFVEYSSAVLETLEGEQFAKIHREVEVGFRVYV